MCNDLNSTPSANRLHIGFFGRRNAGKSSLANVVSGQTVALVSPHAGTTTDPVFKSMELLPLGPVELLDTAGFDDEGDLGLLRVKKTEKMLNRTDLALLVIAADNISDLSVEKQWVEKFKKIGTPTLGILNKMDLIHNADKICQKLSECLKIKFIPVTTKDKSCRALLLSEIVANAPVDFERPVLCGDLFVPGSCVLLVTPQDKQAPKGRLILPQVQVIRDILDHSGSPYLCTLDELPNALASLKKNPNLVITDSQVFVEVERLVPKDVPLTSFSILLARAKGELSQFIHGAKKIGRLHGTDRILIAEACTHAPITEDIGREKIPSKLRKIVGEELQIDIVSGNDFPEDLSPYSLVIHCGGCMFTRKQLMSRQIQASEQNVALTNYGIALAYMNGVLDRVVEIFKNKL